MSNQSFEVLRTDERISVGEGSDVIYSVDTRGQQPPVIRSLVTLIRGLALRINPPHTERMPSVEDTLRG